MMGQATPVVIYVFFCMFCFPSKFVLAEKPLGSYDAKGGGALIVVCRLCIFFSITDANF